MLTGTYLQESAGQQAYQWQQVGQRLSGSSVGRQQEISPLQDLWDSRTLQKNDPFKAGAHANEGHKFCIYSFVLLQITCISVGVSSLCSATAARRSSPSPKDSKPF